MINGKYCDDFTIRLKLLSFLSHLSFLRSEKLMQMVVERQEADHAMSWLSTLGGAFSALGEEFEHCVSCGWFVRRHIRNVLSLIQCILHTG